jgi:hypothetical protein
MKETGSEPIHFKIYENITKDEAKLIEIDFISHFGRVHNGTGILANMTPGGDYISEQVQSRKAVLKRAAAAENIIHPKSKIILQKNQEGEIVDTYNSISLAAKAINVSSDKMYSACKSGKPLKGYLWLKTENSSYQDRDIYSGHLGKPVFQYDLQGNFIKEYKNAPAAHTETQISSSAICCCCNLINPTACGFMWFYEFKGSSIDPFVKTKRVKFPISQFSINGEFIKKWDHISQIANTLGISAIKVSNCCKGIIPNYGGFIWSYVQDVPLPEKFGMGVSKKVYQYTLDGAFVAEFTNAVEASKAVSCGTKKQNSSISTCCIGKTASSYGYQWFFEFKGAFLSDISKPKGKENGINIDEVTEHGEILCSFNSIADACRGTGVGSHLILRSCRINRMVSGRYFKFGESSSL